MDTATPVKIKDMAALRIAKGLSAPVVAESMRRSLGEAHRHPTSVTKMEKIGSYKSNVIRAYAAAVGVTFEEALDYFEALAIRRSKEKKSKNNMRL
jgi:ribosomal protein L7/L12